MRSKNETAWDVDYRDTLQVTTKRSPGAQGDSSLAAGCVLTGDLELQGRVQLNCTVRGEISSSGELIIGEEADINANIFGRVVLIFGRVVGDIKCDERLEMHAGAHVTGNVLSPRVVIQDGVIFEGRCWMGEEQLRSEG